jgi:septation ring formation regulator EzrA
VGRFVAPGQSSINQSYQKSLIIRLEEDTEILRNEIENLESQYELALPAAIRATEAEKNLATISSQVSQVQEL